MCSPSLRIDPAGIKSLGLLMEGDSSDATEQNTFNSLSLITKLGHPVKPGRYPNARSYDELLIRVGGLGARLAACLMLMRRHLLEAPRSLHPPLFIYGGRGGR